MHKRFMAWLLVLFLVVMALTAVMHAAEHLHHRHDFEECPLCIAFFNLNKAVGRLAGTLLGFLFMLHALRRLGLKAGNVRHFFRLLTPVNLKVKLTN